MERVLKPEEGLDASTDFYKKLKDAGFIKQRQKDYYSVRIRLIGGNISAEQLNRLGSIASKYGQGYVTLTARMGIEIPWISFKDLEQVKELVEQAGLAAAGCGPRVRAIVCCKGTVCPYGLFDTQGLVADLDKEFFPQGGMPHKFKIGLSGCPNACSKPQFNDLGFMGQVEPELEESLCTGCELCVEACEEGAIAMRSGIAVRDPQKCMFCGSCIRVCPTEAWKSKRIGVAVFVGGKFGKHPQFGERVADFLPIEEISPVVARTIRFYSEYGVGHERLWFTLQREGIAKFREMVLGEGGN